MRLNTLLLFAALLMSSVAVRADSFRLTGSGVDDTFSLPSSPVVSASGSYGFNIAGVPVNENGIASVDQLVFFSSALGGGLLVQDAAGNNDNGFGVQLYNGPNNAPQFKIGAFALSDIDSYTLTISNQAGAPEPSSMMLLGAGLLAAVAFCRRRSGAAGKRTVAEIAAMTNSSD